MHPTSAPFGLIAQLAQNLLFTTDVVLMGWLGPKYLAAGTLAASASYIAAPAAVRIALPNASPALYLTSSLGVTLPFNLLLGLPLYYQYAKWLST